MTGGYDNYLICSSYAGTPDKNGFARFEYEGDFYFSFMEDGNVILCSEGYSSETSRENGIASVQKNMNLEERYATIQTESGKWACRLKAGNHKEIARSCEVDSEAEARGFFPAERSKAAELKLSAMSVSNSNKEATTSSDDDNYMNCREYEEAFDVSKMQDGIIAFQHSNGQFYFAWFNADGQVILRSEGYASASARDNGIASVKVYRENKNRFSHIESCGTHFLILKAGNNQEIGRSCPKKTAEEVSCLRTLCTAFGNVASICANMMMSDTEVEISDLELPVAGNSEINVPIIETQELDITEAQKPIIATHKIETPDVKVPPVNPLIEENGDRGFRWWWLLLVLGLLLSGPLLWKKYNNLETVATPSIVTDTVVNAVVTTPEFDSAGMAAKAVWEKDLGEMTEITLPDSVKIKVPLYGDEKKLVEYLKAGCNDSIKTTWFNLDRILFHTGESRLNEVSNNQLDNIAAIFKAFGNFTFKIGGYTDNVGNANANLKLSSDRAAAAMTAIQSRGIDAVKMRSEGYGPKYFICKANDTEECKAKNRRIAIRVEKCK
jgi:outer membrane protein OmpA-like peptidoglycan-associated protein/uncharacterized protein YegP (UPF0339 family)